MWIHFNLIMIGMMTILIPSMYYAHPNANIILSSFLFFSGIYLTILYFVLFYYKETKETLQKDNENLQKELNELKKNSSNDTLKV